MDDEPRALWTRLKGESAPYAGFCRDVLIQVNLLCRMSYKIFLFGWVAQLCTVSIWVGDIGNSFD